MVRPKNEYIGLLEEAIRQTKNDLLNSNTLAERKYIRLKLTQLRDELDYVKRSTACRINSII